MKVKSLTRPTSKSAWTGTSGQLPNLNTCHEVIPRHRTTRDRGNSDVIMVCLCRVEVYLLIQRN